MRQKSVHTESPSERLVKTIRRVTRKRHSAEEKIRIVLDGLRGAILLERERTKRNTIQKRRLQTKRKPHNLKPDEPVTPVNQTAICLKLSDDGQISEKSNGPRGDHGRRIGTCISCGSCGTSSVTFQSRSSDGGARTQGGARVLARAHR